MKHHQGLLTILGQCDCESTQWSGTLCESCSDSFYGPSCLPLMMALTIMPDQGLDTGGNKVHVWGHNFPESSNHTYICKFGSTEVHGVWVALNHVVCIAPKHPEGSVIVELSADGLKYTNNQVPLMYSVIQCIRPSNNTNNKLRPKYFINGNNLFLKRRFKFKLV